MIDLEKYNDAVKLWGKSTRDAMIAKGKGMSIQHRSNSPSKGDSLAKIKDKYKQSHGSIDVERFSNINRSLIYTSVGAGKGIGGSRIDVVRFSNINRSLIYTSVGAGKGIGGSRGSKWVDRYGKEQKTNPDSLNKLGAGNRKAKNFMLETLDGAEGINRLGDIAAENLADAVVSFKANDILQNVTLKK